jgi:hypothetical protein
MGRELRIAVKDRAFEPGARAVVVCEGMTLRELVAAALPEALRPLAVVMIGDQVVPVDWWGRIWPKAGSRVLITVRLTGGGGGGGKNPLATVLSLAVMVASMTVAPYLAAGLAQAVGAGTAFSAPLGLMSSGFMASASFMSVATPLIGMGISMVGMMAVSALIPPSSQSMNMLSGAAGSAGESATLSISGGGNRANPYGVVPRVYGRHRITPLYCAEAYTETVGRDQYLYCLFDCGYGPLAVEDIRLGDTPIGEYAGVDLCVHQRWKAGDPLKIYRNDTSVSNLNRGLTAEGGTVVVTSAPDADEVRVDLAFQGLTRFTDQGGQAYQEVTIEAAFRAAGSDDPLTPVLDIGGGTSSVALEPLVVPNGAWYATYITSSAVADAADIKITIPSRWRGSAQIHTVTFTLEVNAPGESAWQKVVTKTVTVNGAFSPVDAGSYVETFRAAAQRGKRLQMRLTLDKQTVWTNDGETALIPPNAAMAAALPEPKVAYLAASPDFIFGDSSAQLVRRAIIVRPPERGQWEIHLTRKTPDSGSDRIRDACSITGVVSTTFTPPIAFEETHTIIELCIKATDQLSGAISDLNLIATSILPVWTGTEWVERECRTPAWNYAQVLRGEEALTTVDDSGLDLDGLLAWAAATDAPAAQSSLPDGVIGDVDAPAMTCDLVVDYETTTRALLTDIAACGRATIGRVEGKIGVVRDVPQTVPRAVITPRNSWGYKGKRVFVDIPHGLRVKYISPEDGWEQAEVVVYADGYSAATATKFEDLEVRGCTRRDQAWRAGRYALAQMQLRPETHEIQMDVENLIFQRGDLVELVHDVPMQGGLTGAVIRTLTDERGVVGVVLDETLSLAAGAALRLRHRNSQGGLSWLPLRAPVQDAETDTVLFVDPVAEDSAPAVGDLCIVGEAGRETVRCIVKEIWPGADLSARVVLVDEAPAVHLADQGAIPPYEARITKRASVTPGPVDALTAQVKAVAVGGRYTYSVGLSWRGVGAYEVYRKIGGLWVSQGLTTRQDWVFENAQRGEVITYAVVAVGTSGARLPLAQAAQGFVSVASAEAVPTDVEGFAGTVLGDRMRLTWEVTAQTVADTWRVRWSSESTAPAVWGAAVDVSGAIAYPASAVEVPARSGTYLIKGFDRWGGESVTAAQVVTTVPDLMAVNVVEEVVEEIGSFGGSGHQIVITPDGVRLDTALEVDDWPDWDSVVTVDYGPTGLALRGTYDLPQVIDLGEVASARVSGSLSVKGLDVADDMDIWPDVDSRTDWDGVDHSAYTVVVQIATSDSDPALGLWSDWSSLVVGDYAARAVKARLVLSTTKPEVTPLVQQVALTVDMADKIAGETDLHCPVGGVEVRFPRAFHVLKALAITGDTLASGDWWEITDRHQGGFRVAFFNGSGVPVARQFDYLAKGY